MDRGRRDRSVVAIKPFNTGDFVCNLNADIYDKHARRGAGANYVMDVYTSTGRFVLNPWDDDKHRGDPGKLLNHSARHPNLKIKLVNGGCGQRFVVAFPANRVIDYGEELLYDYSYAAGDSPEWYTCCPCVKCLPLGDSFEELPAHSAAMSSASHPGPTMSSASHLGPPTFFRSRFCAGGV